MAKPGFFLRRERGFTLIEIAVVIVILALLLTMLVGIASTMIAQQRREATRTRLVAAEAALALFVSQNQRLPCPADGALPSGDPNAGLERITASQCSTGGAAPNQTRGVLPWRALGLSEVDATDGWGNRLTYRVGPQLVAAASMNFTSCDPGATRGGGPTGACNAACTSATFPGSCTHPSDVLVAKGLRIEDLAGNPLMTVGVAGAANPPSTAAAYVVISHGENGQGAYGSSGVIQAATGSTSGTKEAEHAADRTIQAAYYDSFPSYLEDTGHFDDFVVRPTILSVAAKAQLGPRAH